MGKRDARADLVDDDPFRNQRRSPPNSSSSSASSTRWNRPLRNLLCVFERHASIPGAGQLGEAKHHTGRLWHFSDVEKQHLRLAMGAFTLALGFMAVGGVSGISYFGFSPWLVFLLLSMPVWMIGVGPAFLLHEIGHKLVAKKHGCWAEFRADPRACSLASRSRSSSVFCSWRRERSWSPAL